MLRITEACDTKALIQHFDLANVSLAHPCRQGIDIRSAWETNAPGSWVATMNAKGAAGGVEAGFQIKPEVLPPRLWTPQAVNAGRKRGSIPRAPAAICRLAGGNATGRWPAGQQSPATMQFHPPNPVAIGEQVCCSAGAQPQVATIEKRRCWSDLAWRRRGCGRGGSSHQQHHQGSKAQHGDTHEQ